MNSFLQFQSLNGVNTVSLFKLFLCIIRQVSNNMFYWHNHFSDVSDSIRLQEKNPRELPGVEGFRTFEIEPGEVPGLHIKPGNGPSVPVERRIRVVATGNMIGAWWDNGIIRRIFNSQGTMSVANTDDRRLVDMNARHAAVLSILQRKLQRSGTPPGQPSRNFSQSKQERAKINWN